MASTTAADDSREMPKNFYPMLKKLMRNLFDKHYVFKKSDCWKLPSSSDFFSDNYRIETLQVLKGKLNAVKSKLNDVQIEDWSAHTRRRNPSGEVAWRLKNAIDAEFVTQAWCKFYECLYRFPIVLGSKLNSVHLCEAPGAFITALNHYLHSNYRNVEWKWLSTTLNPYYEGNQLANMVIDDRFMLHTLDKWIFGKDFTGNIMKKENVENMAGKAANLGEIHLVTADGSIDCMETPECQEEVVSSLHYAETCAALRMLSPGGSFVLKMFTLFESTSVALMYLLNCVFDQVNVFKPATSKCGNSEVYVVCVGFRKDDPNFHAALAAMMDHLECPDHVPIFAYHTLPDDFLTELENCAKFFMNQQILSIHRNIVSYKNGNRSDGKRSKMIRLHVTNHYLNMYNIRKIREQDKLLYDKNVVPRHFKCSRIYTGSFTERQSLHCKSAEEKLSVLLVDLESLEESLAWPYENNSITISHKDRPQCHKVKLYRGKAIEKILSSLFINVHLMHLINKMVKVSPKNAILPITVTIDSKDVELETKIFSSHQNYSLSERKFFTELLTTIADKKPQSVTIRGLPLLTHFATSFMCLLLKVYRKVTFTATRMIILEQIDSFGMEEWITCLQNLLKESNEIENVLCLVDIKEMHVDPLTEIVTNYNNQNCLQYCRVMINRSSN